MYSSHVDDYRAKSVSDAIQTLKENKGARLLAGGHSLIPSMKLRVANPAMLVDIGRIKELSGIQVDGNTIRIGAFTKHAAVAASGELRTACPILYEAARRIADPQVRNRGTIGGNIANADPASDYPTLMMALGATFTAIGPQGEREIFADDCFSDLLTTVLEQDEVLTTTTIPAYGKMPGMGGVYLKRRHPAEPGACHVRRVDADRKGAYRGEHRRRAGKHGYFSNSGIRLRHGQKSTAYKPEAIARENAAHSPDNTTPPPRRYAFFPGSPHDVSRSSSTV